MDSSASGNQKWDRLLQHKLSNMLIERWNHWKLSTVRMVRQFKGWQIVMDTDNQWWVIEKLGGGEVREVNVREASVKFTRRCSCTLIC